MPTTAYRERIAAVLASARPGFCDAHEVKLKPFFGAVVGYVDGRIFISCGRFGLALKLPSATIRRLRADEGVDYLRYFAHGHKKKDCVVLPPHILQDRRRLGSFLDLSIRFVAGARSEPGG